MRKYLLIMLFGAFGAVLRYIIKNFDLSVLITAFPLNTLFINVTGSFIFSLIITFAYKAGHFHPDLRLGITAGFLGAFTTFSTFCKEIVSLMSAGAYCPAILYVALSLLLGLAGAFAGAWVVKAILIGKYRRLRKIVQARRVKGAAET